MPAADRRYRAVVRRPIVWALVLLLGCGGAHHDVEHAADARVPVRQVPFGQVLTIVRGLWLAFSAFDDLIPPALKAQMVDRAYTRMRDTLTRPRPGRAAPRAVRQPVSGWPRLLTPRTETAPVALVLI